LAVLANPRFIAGELGTHFIESETSLMEVMKEMIGRETPLSVKLPRSSIEKKRVAAVSAVLNVIQART
jgi:pyruvate carboxylase subunit A